MTPEKRGKVSIIVEKEGALPGFKQEDATLSPGVR
jgi:hypothetical protein